MLDSDQTKSRMSCLSKDERKLLEIKPRTDSFTPYSDNDMGSDLDDDTTLEQLKQISKAKRKKSTYIGLHSVKADEDEKKLQDEYDLDEPLIRLKLKLPKNSNAKRKYVNGSFSMSSTIAFAVKSEHNQLSIDHNKGSSYCGVVSKKVLEVVQSENKEPLLHTKECQSCLTNEIAHDHLEDIEPTCMAVPLDSVGVKGENRLELSRVSSFDSNI